MLRALLVCAAVSLAACGGARTTTPGTPPGPGTPSTPDGATTPARAGDVANGEKLFAELGCKGCHGGKGEGGGIGPDLFAKTWDDAHRAEAREIILKGDLDHDPPMPAFEGQVDDAKMADLLAFIAST